MEGERALVYIVKINALKPIPKADRIEIAEINGWQCIVQKGKFGVGDLAVYFSIDTIPDLNDPNTAFMKNANKHGRIKTIKLRGVISQGLLGSINWVSSRGHDISGLKEGDDITQLMGAIKYISADEQDVYPALVGSHIDSTLKFPPYVPKTSERRLQDSPEMPKEVKDHEVIITRKEDGCSATYILGPDGEFYIFGRNIGWSRKLIEENLVKNHYVKVESMYSIEQSMRALGMVVAIQGEIVGPAVNSNRLKLDDYQYRLFNVWDIKTQQYLDWDSVVDIANKLKLQTVPVVFRGMGSIIGDTKEQYLDLAKRQMYSCDIIAEGIVVKTNDHKHPAQRISFKVISNDYLLAHDL